MQQNRHSWIPASIKPETNGRYLVILVANARANHAKTFAGMGQPEIATFHNGIWYARGTLKVAFWQRLPEFKGHYVIGDEGQLPYWEV